MKIIYLDTETTGLDKDKHSIIQLSGIIINSNNALSQEEFNFNIAPYTDAPWSENASLIHSITEEQAKEFPDHREVYLQFSELLGSHVSKYDRTDKFYLCGYNVQFDVDFLRSWFALNGDNYLFSWFHFPPLDVMYLYSWFMIGRRAEMQNFKLGTVYEHVIGKPLEGAHNALTDIKATKEIVDHLFSNYDFFRNKQ